MPTKCSFFPPPLPIEHPERAVANAETWFSSLGSRARGLMVLRHSDANEEANAAAVRDAGFIYLSGGSPLHLLSVLKGSLVFAALANAWRHGAVVAGSSAGAMVLGDPMVDPRGGAFTVGLGLVEQLAVVPHHDSGTSHHFWRTLELAPAGLPVAGIPERTALIRDPDGAWRSAGEGQVTVYLRRSGGRPRRPASLELPPGRAGVQSSSVTVTDSMRTFSLGAPDLRPRRVDGRDDVPPETSWPNSE